MFSVFCYVPSLVAIGRPDVFLCQRFQSVWRDVSIVVDHIDIELFNWFSDAKIRHLT